MAKLPKFELGRNDRKDRWDLTDANDRVVKTFERKQDAVQGGVLEQAIGRGGGSVRIRKMDGTFQEERTFPRRADPKKSPG